MRANSREFAKLNNKNGIVWFKYWTRWRQTGKIRMFKDRLSINSLKRAGQIDRVFVCLIFQRNRERAQVQMIKIKGKASITLNLRQEQDSMTMPLCIKKRRENHLMGWVGKVAQDSSVRKNYSKIFKILVWIVLNTSHNSSHFSHQKQLPKRPLPSNNNNNNLSRFQRT